MVEYWLSIAYGGIYLYCGRLLSWLSWTKKRASNSVHAQFGDTLLPVGDQWLHECLQWSLTIITRCVAIMLTCINWAGRCWLTASVELGHVHCHCLLWQSLGQWQGQSLLFLSVSHQKSPSPPLPPPETPSGGHTPSGDSTPYGNPTSIHLQPNPSYTVCLKWAISN